MLQKTVAIWKEKGIADQYLVYGKEQPGTGVPFNWEAVPYYKPRTIIGRIWQQLSVLYRITFGGATASLTQRQKQIKEYKTSFEDSSELIQKQIKKVDDTIVGHDAFCKDEVIDKQSVLKGRTVNVLYNYAPIGFGGERLHFLIVPKKHRTRFSDLAEEEYLEATKLTQALSKHFYKTRSIQNGHIFHKTGEDAGQTVPHWHMNMILTANKAQGFFGKLTVLKNMLFGSSPMKDAALKEKVQSLRSELEYLQNER